MSLLARLVTSNCRRVARPIPSRTYSSFVGQRSATLPRSFLWGGALAVATSLSLSATTIYSDASVKPSTKTEESEDQVGEFLA